MVVVRSEAALTRLALNLSHSVGSETRAALICRATSVRVNRDGQSPSNGRFKNACIHSSISSQRRDTWLFEVPTITSITEDGTKMQDISILWAFHHKPMIQVYGGTL